jgi:predicted secreted protein
MSRSLLILVVLCSWASADRVDADDVQEIELKVGGEVYLTVTSNLSTGYMWSIVPINNYYVEVSDELTGTYEPPTSGLMGAPGKQVFHLVCSPMCVDGAESRVVLVSRRSWEAGAIETKNIKVKIVA